MLAQAQYASQSTKVKVVEKDKDLHKNVDTTFIGTFCLPNGIALKNFPGIKDIPGIDKVPTLGKGACLNIANVPVRCAHLSL